RCHRAYVTAPEPIRRQINQGFFVKRFIAQDGSVARAELTEPFAALLAPDLSARLAGNGAPDTGRPSRMARTATGEAEDSHHGTHTAWAGRVSDRPNDDVDHTNRANTESDDDVTPS